MQRHRGIDHRTMSPNSSPKKRGAGSPIKRGESRLPKMDLSALNLKKWKAIITESTKESVLTATRERVLPVVEISNQLMAHTNVQVAAITAMMRADNPPDSVGELTKRLGPVIALKEVLDIHISQQCENILDELEQSIEPGQKEEDA